MGAKLHELLAVEGDLGGKAKKLLDEAQHTLARQPDHFTALATRTEYFDEARAQDENTEEYSEMVTTVADKLRGLIDPMVNHLDAMMQKELTNQTAKADLILGGEIIARDLPGTFLLSLETYFKRVREVYNDIPVLRPGVKWEPDSANENVYIAPEATTFRNEKVRVSDIVAPATPQHQAQVDIYHEDKKVARIIKTESSGNLTPLDKSRIIGRLDDLIRAIKQARQRANTAEVVNGQLGGELMAYIHGSEV